MYSSGMPHVLAEDTIYEGYLIKEGTTLMADIRYASLPLPERARALT